jgi:hypothetical protein
MWTSTVNFDVLQNSGRWKVEFFCSPTASAAHPVRDGLIPIRDLVTERKETVEPKTLGNVSVNYIGLEHIQSLSGELVNFRARNAREIKSRSKVFKEGDILFGRLRPNLNKVWLAGEPVFQGICSTEFLVLMPDKRVVLPMVMRYLLSSHYVQRHAIRLQTGTALPRMNLDDLLDVEVPVPPMEVQQGLEVELNRRFKELKKLRARVQDLPDKILNDFLTASEAA